MADTTADTAADATASPAQPAPPAADASKPPGPDGMPVTTRPEPAPPRPANLPPAPPPGPVDRVAKAAPRRPESRRISIDDAVASLADAERDGRDEALAAGRQLDAVRRVAASLDSAERHAGDALKASGRIPSEVAQAIAGEVRHAEAQAAVLEAGLDIARAMIAAMKAQLADLAPPAKKAAKS